MKKKENKTLGRFGGNPFFDPLVKPEGDYAYYLPSKEKIQQLRDSYDQVILDEMRNKGLL